MTQGLDEVVITLAGLRVSACHGVLAVEKTEPQPFVVDVRVGATAPDGDDIDDTLDYRTIADLVIARLCGPGAALIETLAGDIRDALLESQRVRWVQVCVHKPEAPLGVAFTDLSVSVVGKKPAPPNLDAVDAGSM
jgi:dihydroneopterin aldolase